jgi:hypothetical protein
MNRTERRSLDLTLTLLVTEDEATRGAKKRVEVSRIVRCSACFATYRAGPGCGACDGGLLTRDEVLFVTVPAGVVPGQELRLAGKGHESSRDDAGDLYLKIALPKVVETLPKTAKKTFAELFRDRETRPAFFIAGLMAVPFVLWGAERAIAHSKAAPVGAACASNVDCRSNLCMSLFERDTLQIAPGSPAIRMLPRKTGAVCTEECTTDADCPASMTCEAANRSERLSGMPDLGLGSDTPNTYACSPRPRPSTVR